ncbi:hypothetical protein AK812_SmicGene5930 [Symbiodinium microadriaticum]|uniref:Uncharacterized protein n=1 Tax=Symbiodinium microadriaticum TaxID=2951 RepID=A0A1Q9ESI2_SYMMI|nr:hypothetical protein AK812_SmicGene5930 [Symbiodinium microadriaticum]CAE7703859.1 unnamed protein product [Symbiodinium sp. KB8]
MLDARVWRGYRDRQYVSSLAAEKERYKCLLRSAITIQSGVRMALSKREVNRRKLIRYAMGISTIQRQARIFLLRKELYEKQVFMAPWEDEDPGAEEKPKTEKKTNFVDMFKKVGVSNWEVMAIVHCQRLARGHTRGYSVRRRSLSDEAFVKRFLAQAHRVLFELPAFTGYLHIGITNNVKMFAATMIQALWPIKGWFEYTATGRDTVQVEVCFLANPSFDDYKYFLKNGSTSALQLSLEELEADLASAMSTIQGSQIGGIQGVAKANFGAEAPSAKSKAKSERQQKRISIKEEGKAMLSVRLVALHGYEFRAAACALRTGGRCEVQGFQQALDLKPGKADATDSTTADKAGTEASAGRASQFCRSTSKLRWLLMTSAPLVEIAAWSSTSRGMKVDYVEAIRDETEVEVKGS